MAGTKLDLALLRTLSEEELAHTLEMSPESLADLAETLVRNPNSTIEPPRPRSDAPGRQALADLDKGDHRGGIETGLTLGSTIGEGGMGLVRSATQRSLGRKVAVKTLRPQTKSEQATIRLLREAWVTGSLEHPNIVPVYDLGLAEDGSPIIILKHIEGAPWSELLAHPEKMKTLFKASDLLEQNLRILVTLCNAVALAHSRGVLHRDLKPENVMIGRFGEVYLVDWGIAVSLIDDPTGRLPLAKDATEMAGTPAYMAPEMLGAMGRLEPRTDVYLLGAILHEILVGKPPHTGQSFQQIVASILLSKFKFPEHVPPELGAIAAKAMSRSAEDRFNSADELREKIEWYLRHRGSLQLSSEAALRVGEMRSVVRSDTDDAAEKMNRLFAEARFGFRQAIRACDDNDAARTGLREAAEIVVVFELDRGNPEAAAAALAELDEPPPELSKRVAAAMRAREEERRRVKELERLEEAHNPLTGRRTRVAVGLMLGGAWTILPQVSGYLHRRSPDAPHWHTYVVTLIVIAFAIGVGTWGRESMSKTLVNRRTQATVLVMFSTQLALQMGGHLLGIPRLTLWVLHIYSWFAIAAAFAVLVDFRFVATAFAMLGCFLVASVYPDQCFNAMSLANLVLLVNITIAWSRPHEDGGFFVERMKQRKRALYKRRDPM